MAFFSVTYTFVNGTQLDATQVNTNFQDIVDATSDGTSDFNISGLTMAGALLVNGNITLGNATSDDVTIGGSIAASIPIKTNASFNFGGSTTGLASVYLGNSTFTTRLLAGATSSWSMTLPIDAGSLGASLITNGSGVTSWQALPGSQIRADTAPAAGHGSSSTTVRRFVNFTTVGTAITASDVSTTGTIFTINEAGIYAISYTDRKNAGGFNIGITVNATAGQLTTSIETISNTNRLCSGSADGSNGTLNVGATIRLAASDIIRAQDDGGTTNSAGQAQFIITQVTRL